MAENGRRVAIVAVTAVLIAGIGIGVVMAQDDGDDAPAAPNPALEEAQRPDNDPFTPEEEPVANPTAGSPEEAASAFLAAERDRDPDTGFRYLSDADRSEYGDAGGWQERALDRWPVRAYDVTGVEDGNEEEEVVVTAEVRLAPSLDEIQGLVPAEAELTLPVLRQEGAWRVAWTESFYQPRYPSDDLVKASVETWVAAHQACEEDVEEYAEFLGDLRLAEELCGAEGEVRTGRMTTIDQLGDAAPYLNAFGPTAGDWARVTPLEGPVEMDIVAAPLGDAWIVVGANPPLGGDG